MSVRLVVDMNLSIEWTKTDSIRKLATFWDTHDVTDFENDLEEVTGPVFQRVSRAASASISVPLEQREAEDVERMASAKGVSREELIRTWVVQQIARRSNARSRVGK